MLILNNSINTMHQKRKPEIGVPGLSSICYDTENTIIPILAESENLYKTDFVMQCGFIQIPRSLLEHPSYISSRVTHKILLITIIQYAVFSPCQHNDHGVMIDLEPGQFCCTYRQLAELAGISKNCVERGMKRFTSDKIIRQEVRHLKTIITITHQDTYDLFFPEVSHDLRLKRDKNETQKNNANTSFSKKRNLKEKKPAVEKIAYREFVFLTSAQHASLLAERGKSVLDAMLDELDAYKGSTGKTYDSDYHTMKGRGWVLQKVLNADSMDKKPLGNRESVLQKFKHGEIYNDATCYINQEGIAFQRGSNHAQLRFSEKGFKDQLQSILIKFGIQ